MACNSNFDQNFELEISLNWNFELEITLDYFFELELSLNYSETYFELDSEEATHCHHCHLISCVYIKGHAYQYKGQSNACRCEMVLKESKGALTVLIVTHVKRVKSSVCGSYTTLYTE